MEQVKLEKQEDLNKVVEQLSAVKDGLLKLGREAKSPTALHAVQVAVDHLDTTYMWVNQCYMLDHMFGSAGVEAAAAAGAGNGQVQQVDFSPAGK